MSIAERMFDGSDAQMELEGQLWEAGVPFKRVGWDYYDCSLELHGIPAEYRLSADVQRLIHAAGFVKVYVNHEDKWETHYSWRNAEFAESKGWRVSYPHKRGESEKSIWVEEHINGWPPDWFRSGYVIIKPEHEPQRDGESK